MSKTGYLGLDLGGTGAKAGVYDETGTMLAFGSAACTPSVYADGRAEIPIEDIYKAAVAAVREAVSQSGAGIRALAISSQGQTFVSLDERDRPLHPAIIWYDSRASEQAERMKQAMPSCKPTPVVEAIATAPKILWLRENYPEMMSRAHRYALLPDYFSFLLTGEVVTDPTIATSTGLYADDAPGYCPEALAAAQIDENRLAEIRLSGTPVGTIRPEIAGEWGLSDDTLLVVGTNDQYAGALGAGNCRPGIISETTGTCLALVILTEKAIDPWPRGLWIGRFPIPRYQFALAYAKTAGVVLDWFNREMCPNLTLRELDEMAAASPVGSNGITILPHFDGVVSPEPKPNAKGHIGGLTLGSSLADIYRAILESLTFSLRENVELLTSNGFHPEVIRSIGGGAKSDFWLQMKSDVTGLPVERPLVSEAATLGAAMLATVGVGHFASAQECSKNLYKVGHLFTPDEAAHISYSEPYLAYRNLCKRVY